MGRGKKRHNLGSNTGVMREAVAHASGGQDHETRAQVVDTLFDLYAACLKGLERRWSSGRGLPDGRGSHHRPCKTANFEGARLRPGRHMRLQTVLVQQGCRSTYRLQAPFGVLGMPRSHSPDASPVRDLPPGVPFGRQDHSAIPDRALSRTPRLSRIGQSHRSPLAASCHLYARRKTVSHNLPISPISAIVVQYAELAVARLGRWEQASPHVACGIWLRGSGGGNE